MKDLLLCLGQDATAVETPALSLISSAKSKVESPVWSAIYTYI